MGIGGHLGKNLLAGAAMLSALPFAAHAQEGSAALSAPEATDGIGDIVVTAQKREENLQRVPIAISAVTGDQLAKQGVTNVTGIASQVPNFQITTPYSDAIPIFALRGISAVDYSQNQSSPIALYVDEVYKGLPVFTSLQLFDIDRVEVLRGPQGTLFGKNTTGGAVNITTRTADVGEGFTGDIAAGYGRFDRFELSGGVNIPLVTDKLAARVAFKRTKADGFVKNLTSGVPDQNSIDDWAVRLSVTAKPTDRLTLMLRYTRSHSTPDGYGVLATDIGPGGVGFFSGYRRQGLGFFENETDRAGFLDIKNQSASLRLNWEVSGSATLTSVTSYDRGTWLTEEDGDGTPINFLTGYYASRGVSFSQDLRLASSGNGPLKWLVGAYFYRDRVNAGQTQRYYFDFAGDADGNGQLDCFDDALTGCSYTNSLRQVRKSFAAYTHNELELGGGFTATLGLRYTHDDNRLGSYEASLGYFDPVAGVEIKDFIQTISGVPATNRLKSDNLSGKIGLSYETPGGSLIYANASRGYRGGSFNGAALFDPSEITIAVPERLDALELGAKLQTADRRIRLNSAIFYYDYKNQQFIDTTPQFTQILYNAPKSELWGVETELTAKPSRNLLFRFGASYLHAKYKKIALQGQDLAGNRLAMAPKWTLSGGVDWDIIEGSFGSLSLHTDSRYTSRTYFSAFNTDGVSQRGYTVHDARLTLTTLGGKLDIAGWITNITNKKYKVYSLNLQEGFNLNYAQRGRPREYGVQATVHF